MIKNITLTLILCCIIFSCGKKGDPEYKVSSNESKIENIIINQI